ncbi:MAG: carbohydrate-binding domain-containing protein, partial [Oscillospiraceae bacterium]|nr:carbohydrate-binding domain-containing protein [Oscillospiraceae bacterium]
MKSRFLTACGVSLAVLMSAVQLPAGVLQAHALPSGDLNGDGKLNASDVKMLRDWLTSESKTLNNWSVADYDGNRMLDVVDLSMMKTAAAAAPAVVVVEPDPDPAYIHLKGSSITSEGSNYISISGTTATITRSGTYYIDGTLNNGQILVNIPDEAADPNTVKLFLDGVKITNGSAPCIMIENAENTSVNLVENKENSLSDGKAAPAEGAAEVEPEYAVLHAKDDLTIKGDGSLEIKAGMQYGIHCNNDLKFNGGKVNVTADGADAVRGKTSVTVKDGSLTIDTAGDGLKSTKGDLTISGGNLDIKSSKDAIQSETNMELTGGTIRACGDRGLTAGGVAHVEGCSLLATASDKACENLSKAAGTMQLSFTKQWKKN